MYPWGAPQYRRARRLCTDFMSTVASNNPKPQASTRITAWFTDWVSDWGELVISSCIALGDFCLFVLSTFRWMFSRIPRGETLWPNFYQVGVSSLPVVALTGTFIGVVLALQSSSQLGHYGLTNQLGGVINLTLVRELGPVLAATMLAGRVGSAMAAELGTMRVTEQIDALSAMGADPIHYLVVPRFLACLLFIPTLTIMADFMGVAGGYFYSNIWLNIDQHYYWTNSAKFVNNFDLFTGILKSLFFGSAISLISCYQGFNCKPGAEGVGKAATSSFVFAFIVILILDLSLGLSLKALYESWYPGGTY